MGYELGVPSWRQKREIVSQVERRFPRYLHHIAELAQLRRLHWTLPLLPVPACLLADRDRRPTDRRESYLCDICARANRESRSAEKRPVQRREEGRAGRVAGAAYAGRAGVAVAGAGGRAGAVSTVPFPHISRVTEGPMSGE